MTITYEGFWHYYTDNIFLSGSVHVVLDRLWPELLGVGPDAATSVSRAPTAAASPPPTNTNKNVIGLQYKHG